MKKNKVKIEFLDRSTQHSDYDWANIEVGSERVGKARCRLLDNKFIIYSINIFPEFEGNGYGKIFAEHAKSHYDHVVADRVRSTAVGFWKKLGFTDDGDGNFSFRKKKL